MAMTDLKNSNSSAAVTSEPKTTNSSSLSTSNNKSETVASIPRASSNLELLSQTAAWKNDWEKNPARVSPSATATSNTNKPTGRVIISPHQSQQNLASHNSAEDTSASPCLDHHHHSSLFTTGYSGFEESPPSLEDASLSFPPSNNSTAPAPGSGPWEAAWRSMMFPTVSSCSSSNLLEDNSNKEEMRFASSAQSAFRRPPYRAHHPAFAPPLSSDSSKRSWDETAHPPSGGDSQQRVTQTTKTTTTTTTTTVIPATTSMPAISGHGSLATTSSSEERSTPQSLLLGGLDRTGSWSTWTAPPLSNASAPCWVDELVRDNALLKRELQQSQQQVSSLQQQLDEVKTQLDELRQLPVGKISQIPVADMLELMQTYGSEVSDHTHVPLLTNPVTSQNAKRPPVQKASIVRQFRRWNPHFHEYFTFSNGKWVPKLGKEAEQERRSQSRARRRFEKVTGGNASQSSTTTGNSTTSSNGTKRSNKKPRTDNKVVSL